MKDLFNIQFLSYWEGNKKKLRVMNCPLTWEITFEFLCLLSRWVEAQNASWSRKISSRSTPPMQSSGTSDPWSTRTLLQRSCNRTFKVTATGQCTKQKQWQGYWAITRKWKIWRHDEWPRKLLETKSGRNILNDGQGKDATLANGSDSFITETSKVTPTGRCRQQKQWQGYWATSLKLKCWRSDERLIEKDFFVNQTVIQKQNVGTLCFRYL